MPTLILTCNTGEGHNSCARAIQRIYQANREICDIADSLQFSSGRLSCFMSWGHTTMYRHIPGLFRWGYGFAEKHPSVMQEDRAVSRLFSSGANRLRDYIVAGGYNNVICAHVLSGLLLEQMQKEYRLKIKTAFVATDYTCSPGTGACNYDRCFIPHASLIREFVDQGVPGDRIIVSGIPIDDAFYASCEKAQAKKRLGMDPTHTHLLMMCGSMGCGSMKELAKILQAQMDASMELSIVCGTNEKLRRNLESMVGEDSNIHVYGFTNSMNDLMDSADLYLTKPGGLSTTEAAAKKLPMVLIDAVSGCEKHNMRFFTENGGAVTADTPQRLGELCVALMKNPLKMAEMSAGLSVLGNACAANVIFAAMQNMNEAFPEQQNISTKSITNGVAYEKES